MIDFGQGRISQLIDIAKKTFHVDNVEEIAAKDKLQILCDALAFSVEGFDSLLVRDSSILRTLNGHAFETVFDIILKFNGVVSKEIGGDTEIDREVNGLSLQLKTPYKAGTTDEHAQYKTHKTHGAKSEQESLDYYSKAEHFADYFIGLISYEPLSIIFLPKNELPRHAKDDRYIKSPFEIEIKQENINRFDIFGIDSVKVPNDIFSGVNELLPKTSKFLNLNSEIIINTIFNAANFRIWDMNIRGFARESSFCIFLEEQHIAIFDAKIANKPRSEKSDLALKLINGEPIRFQVKGITNNGCSLTADNVKIDIETQLSRGRVNDHPTRSRLYLFSDFDYLLVSIDPYYVYNFTKISYGIGVFEWRFYCMPSNILKSHKEYSNRIASHQYIMFKEIEKFLIGKDWFRDWLKI